MEMHNPKSYTVEEFEAIADATENAERLLELINGEIVEKVPTQLHGQCVINVGSEFNLYARKIRLGRVGTEVRHRKPNDNRNARMPDVSFTIRRDNEPMVTKGSVMRMPDVAVEIKSPDDDLKALREKIRYYLQNGTRLAWLVIPEKQEVEVYTSQYEGVLIETDTLEGGDVLPGFKMAVRDVFYDPAEGE